MFAIINYIGESWQKMKNDYFTKCCVFSPLKRIKKTQTFETNWKRDWESMKWIRKSLLKSQPKKSEIKKKSIHEHNNNEPQSNRKFTNCRTCRTIFSTFTEKKKDNFKIRTFCSNKNRLNRTKKIVRLNYIQVKRFTPSGNEVYMCVWMKTQKETHAHMNKEDISWIVFSTIVNVYVRIRV